MGCLTYTDEHFNLAAYIWGTGLNPSEIAPDLTLAEGLDPIVPTFFEGMNLLWDVDLVSYMHTAEFQQLGTNAPKHPVELF